MYEFALDHERYKGRYSFKPIEFDDLYQMYKKSRASYWQPEEPDLSKDRRHWRDSLTEKEREFISKILSFFAVSDGVVSDNIVERFSREVAIPEAKVFYQFQGMMENIHAEMYSKLIEDLVEDEAKMKELPTMGNKIKWMEKWSNSGNFSERLLAFAAVEGIFFSGSFAVMFWLKKRGLMPGLTFSNELVCRDEGIHCDFACLLYTKYITNKAPARDRGRCRHPGKGIFRLDHAHRSSRDDPQTYEALH
jgi:ribonucleoside-diphosphate reductase beta chain